NHAFIFAGGAIDSSSAEYRRIPLAARQAAAGFARRSAGLGGTDTQDPWANARTAAQLGFLWRAADRSWCGVDSLATLARPVSGGFSHPRCGAYRTWGRSDRMASAWHRSGSRSPRAATVPRLL